MPAITSKNVFLPGQDACTATVVFDGESGKITSVQRGPPSDDTAALLDLGDAFVLPGLVDCHVHLNEPGRTEWEGFATGTLAAASGGVTTLVDMPLNSIPPVTTVAGLEAKRSAAEGQLSVDVAFWGGVIPGNSGDLKPLIEAGVRGFKCFLIESGVEEFPCVSERDLVLAMTALEGTGVPLLFHAEFEDSPAPSPSADPTLYQTFLDSRPDSFETSAINLVISLQQRFPSVPCHIVHLSSAAALPAIRAAKDSGAKLTVETCYHYLCLTAEEIPRSQTQYKCCPPIRSSTNREALWEALRDGTIDFVVSDHSPSCVLLKNLETGDMMTAWGGISALGLGISLLWTEASKRGFSMKDIVRWTSERTARFAGLEGVKGAIAVGLDADFSVFEQDAADVRVTKDSLRFKNKLSPFEGFSLRGRVSRTIVRGQTVFKEGRLVGNPTGQKI